FNSLNSFNSWLILSFPHPRPSARGYVLFGCASRDLLFSPADLHRALDQADEFVAIAVLVHDAAALGSCEHPVASSRSLVDRIPQNQPESRDGSGESEIGTGIRKACAAIDQRQFDQLAFRALRLFVPDPQIQHFVRSDPIPWLRGGGGRRLVSQGLAVG